MKLIAFALNGRNVFNVEALRGKKIRYHSMIGLQYSQGYINGKDSSIPAK